MAILNASKRHQPNTGLKMTDLFAQANQANNISFGMGLPDETVFPSAALQKLLRKQLRKKEQIYFSTIAHKAQHRYAKKLRQ